MHVQCKQNKHVGMIAYNLHPVEWYGVCILPIHNVGEEPLAANAFMANSALRLPAVLIHM